MTFDIIILGGGAAGLFCASRAAARGRKVVVLDASNKLGKKILMSGGGRCNFTNLGCEPGNYLSANPHFVKSALASYSQWDFLALVDDHGIPHHEKTLGQLFCDRSSRDILDLLLAECQANGVELHTRHVTHAVTALAGGGYAVEGSLGRIEAESLVIATGGLSIPKMGASGFGYEIARQFGLAVRPTRAGLVPFTFSGIWKERCERLAGVSFEGRVSAEGTGFREGVLFSHRGLTGPAALQASSYWLPGSEVAVDLLPGEDALAWLLDLKQSQPKARLRTQLNQRLAKKLVEELEQAFWPQDRDRALAEWSRNALERVAGLLSGLTLVPSGTEGYRTAEVTLGGVDTDALSSRTMEVKSQPGLYFIGEVVDVTGHLGGYNFQWAWSSAAAAARVC